MSLCTSAIYNVMTYVVNKSPPEGGWGLGGLGRTIEKYHDTHVWKQHIM